MNLFELLGLVIWVACGIAGATYLRHHWGPVGIPTGFLLGAGAAFGAHRLFFSLLGGWVPELPPCQCGISSQDAFQFEEWLKDEAGGIIGGVYICRGCDKRYLKTKRRFQQIMADGSLIPYMMHRPLGRWELENKEPKRQQTV